MYIIDNMYFHNEVKEIRKIFLNVCFLKLLEEFSRDSKTFESAVVNKSLVFESLKFYWVSYFVFQIFWTHNGMQIEEDDLHVVETIEEENLLQTTLTIENVTSQDAGTYKVVAQNDAGEETVSASLIVKGRWSDYLRDKGP